MQRIRLPSAEVMRLRIAAYRTRFSSGHSMVEFYLRVALWIAWVRGASALCAVRCAFGKPFLCQNPRVAEGLGVAERGERTVVQKRRRHPGAEPERGQSRFVILWLINGAAGQVLVRGIEIRLDSVSDIVSRPYPDGRRVPSRPPFRRLVLPKQPRDYSAKKN